MEGVLPALPWVVATARLKVPYLAPPIYQHPDTSFYDFPQRSGFLRTDDAAGLVRSCETIGSLASLLQSWLFFELLSAFLERPINRSDFDTHGFVDINQKLVHDHFRDWKARLSRRSQRGKQRTRKSIEKTINFASRKSDVFEEAADLLGSGNEDFDRVALSVKLLISLLNSISDDTFSAIGSRLSAFWTWIPFVPGTNSYPSDKHLSQMGKGEARRYLYRQPKWHLPLPPGDEYGGRATKRLLRLFVDNGWCPYRARQMCRSYDYLVLDSLAGLKCQRAPTEDHRQCMQIGRCCAHDLIVNPTSVYPFQHATEGEHDCEFIHVPKEEIINIIKSGGIPLISMSLEDDLDVKVVRCTPYITYTAISHVWSDGLGNPESNALPRCQLFRLRDMIHQTYFPQFSPFYDDRTTWSRSVAQANWESWGSARPGRPIFTLDQKRVFFWMDTLCIPVSGRPHATEEDKELKFRAIKHITPIFAGAFNALVLDRGLEDTSIPVPNQVNVDELAALVLNSKWMQRGWTLEEGSLAQTCVFQLMGKPYEMSDPLKTPLPVVESHHSPLDRAFINARRLAPQLLGRALLDEKRQLSRDPLLSRVSRLEKLLRIPQFVWTWNSLLERSTTEPQDGPIIFANMLDFNVHSLKVVPRQDRLALLVQNCDELPLSILYNTGPRMRIKGHPELGWIPKEVAGDHLVVGAALYRTNPRRAGNQVKFSIGRSDSEPESLLILKTLSGQCIPYDVEVFTVQDCTTPNGDADQEYFVQIQRPSIQGPDGEEIRRLAGEIYGQSVGTCIVIDLACGTPSLRGCVGRGARFSIDSCNQGSMTLKYDAPLIAWTQEQWQRKCNGPITCLCFDTVRVAREQRLLLNYDASTWGRKLTRRPILTQHPPMAKMVGSFVFLIILLLIVVAIGYAFVSIREALGFRAGLSPHSTIVVLIFGPICTTFIYQPIRRRLAMYTYIAWLKSFEEEWEAPQARRDRSWRFLDAFLGRFRRGTARGVTQMSIDLPLRGRGNNGAEFPGEIFLE